MFKKTKSWYAGLSTVAKGLVIAVASVFAVTAVSAANSSPSSSDSATIVQEGLQESGVETKTITETKDIVFSKTTVNDAALEKGKTSIRTAGVNGIKTLTYSVAYKDGKETDRKLIKEEITKEPIAEVTALGTYIKPAPPPAAASSSCDSNYSGCVPIASDVDCAGGSGNGPAYVRGPVTVTGYDVYDLDRDGDGVACDR